MIEERTLHAMRFLLAAVIEYGIDPEELPMDSDLREYARFLAEHPAGTYHQFASAPQAGNPRLAGT
jgi:hypothetical protein